MAGLELSIVQEDCTSCGLCPDIVPRHFFMGDDGYAYVKEAGAPSTVRFVGFEGKVAVAGALEQPVIDAAEECPGKCIYIEYAGNV